MQFDDIERDVHECQTNLKRWWQRRTRGWDDSDTWSLDYTTAKFLLPRLKRFKELNNGYPDVFACGEDWDIAIDKMIFAMEYCIKLGGSTDLSSYNNDNRVKALEGFELFGKHFMSLWW